MNPDKERLLRLLSLRGRPILLVSPLPASRIMSLFDSMVPLPLFDHLSALWRFSADTGALGNLRAFGNRLHLNLIYKDAPMELTVLSRFKDYTA